MVVRLTYFDMMGLGEPVRLMLATSKIDFEDKRVTKEEWIKLKPTLKWPFLPMLEIEGKVLFQSMAICRYLANQAGLNGSSVEEALEIDMTVYALEDMRKSTVVHYYKPDSEERDQGLKTATSVTIPLFLEKFQEQLAENNGYFVAGKFTWADIIFISHCDYLNVMVGEDILANFPKLTEHYQKISQLPGIKEWIDSRPQSPKDLRLLF